MNRLWFRLTLALVAITLISVAVVSVLAQVNATAQFGDLFARQRAIAQSALTDALTEHYTANGSWDGAEDVLRAALPNFSRAPGQPGPDGPPGAGRSRGRGSTSFVLADPSGRVLAATSGRAISLTLSSEQLAASLPISVDDIVVGRLLVSSPESDLLAEAQQIVIGQLRRYAIGAGLIVSVFAIVLGVLTSRALSAPLAQLAASARALSDRRWDVRAKVEGAQEIADAARAFNNMADSLQQAEINRRNMTADIAHELRTPLTVIQGNLRAMLDDVYPLDRAEIATIYDETQLLGRLVEDLRLLALAEAGQLDLKPRDEDAHALLRAAAAQYQIAAEAKGVRLVVEAAGAPLLVRADLDRVGQVLRNLISNALRHTPDGGVITLSLESLGTHARLRVTDTGDGIPAESLQHIWDRFYRGDASRARASGGTGLGLAIVKGLVEAVGGGVGVESRAGQGSTLWFTLPLAA